ARLHPVALQELLHPAFRVDDLLLAGIEGVAIRADFHSDLRLGRLGLEVVAAGAVDDGFLVLRMDSSLHGGLLLVGAGRNRLRRIRAAAGQARRPSLPDYTMSATGGQIGRGVGSAE